MKSYLDETRAEFVKRVSQTRFKKKPSIEEAEQDFEDRACMITAYIVIFLLSFWAGYWSLRLLGAL